MFLLFFVFKVFVGLWYCSGVCFVFIIFGFFEFIKEWLVEVKGMVDCIIEMCECFYNKFVEFDIFGEWGYIKF